MSDYATWCQEVLAGRCLGSSVPGEPGFEIRFDQVNGFTLELLDDAGQVVKRIAYTLPAGRERDAEALKAAHRAAWAAYELHSPN